MFTEHDWVHERIRLYHLMKDHPDWGNRRLGRELGHDPRWVAKWKARFRSRSQVTLETFRSASRAPKHVPHRTTPEAKAVIAELRTLLSEHFHRKAGAKTIQYGIRQYRKLYPDAPILPRSRSAIYRALHELGCILPRRPHLHLPLVLLYVVESNETQRVFW
jgi:hypothetical protein